MALPTGLIWVIHIKHLGKSLRVSTTQMPSTYISMVIIARTLKGRNYNCSHGCVTPLSSMLGMRKEPRCLRKFRFRDPSANPKFL